MCAGCPALKLTKLKGETKMKMLMTVVVAVACCAVFADGPKGDNGRGERGMRLGMAGMTADPIARTLSDPKMVEKLGLSEEQQKKIKKIQKSNRGDAMENQKKLRKAMDRQMKLLMSEKVDESAVMAAIDEVFDIRKDLAKAQTKQVIEMKSILTSEQLKQARSSFKEMRKRFGRMGDEGDAKVKDGDDDKGKDRVKGEGKKGRGRGRRHGGEKKGGCDGCEKDAPAED